MKARKKPLDTMTPQDLKVVGTLATLVPLVTCHLCVSRDLCWQVDIKTNLSITLVEDPPTRKAGGKVKDVDELILKLKGEGGVL